MFQYFNIHNTDDLMTNLNDIVSTFSKEEQQRRFEKRLNNPLKKWKFSPVDQKGQELWDDFTSYKNQMFSSLLVILLCISRNINSFVRFLYHKDLLLS